MRSQDFPVHVGEKKLYVDRTFGGDVAAYRVQELGWLTHASGDYRASAQGIVDSLVPGVVVILATTPHPTSVGGYERVCEQLAGSQVRSFRVLRGRGAESVLDSLGQDTSPAQLRDLMVPGTLVLFARGAA